MKNRKKILYIHPSAGGGGASARLHLLVRYIYEKSNYQPIVLFGAPGLFEKMLRKKGIKTYIKKFSTLAVNTHSPKLSFRNIITFMKRFIPYFITVVRIIKKEQISFVHINSSVSTTAGIASYFSGVKVVWHVREIIPDTKMGRLQKKLIESIAVRIIAISGEVAKQFDSRKTTLIYDGIDPEDFKSDTGKEIIRKKYDLTDKENIFVHIGQLFPAKGSFVFLKAAKLLIESGYKAKYFVIGGAVNNVLDKSFIKRLKAKINYLLGRKTIGWKEELEKYAEKNGLSGKVIFTGFRTDIPDFITVSDAVVSPHCVPEPFGLTLIEAGALRKPVISTNIPPTPEIVVDGKTGILVEPNNSRALAKAMESIINNPRRAQKMGNNGYRNIINNFHINTTHAKIKNIYKEVLMEKC